MEPLFAAPMIAFVEKGPDVSQLYEVFDDVSLRLGDRTGLTYCGDRQYTFVGATPATPAYSEFLSMNVVN